MRPPGFGGGSDSEDSSSDEDTADNSSSVAKITKITADLTLDDKRLHSRVISHQEDEKAITRLLAISKERINLFVQYNKKREQITAEFFSKDTALVAKEKEALAAKNTAESFWEGIKAQRKDAFQAYFAQEGQVAQDEGGITLSLANEVEKVANKTSLREEADKETIDSLLQWLRDLKNEKKALTDNSMARIEALRNIANLRDSVAADKTQAKFTEAETEVNKIKDEQAKKDGQIWKNQEAQMQKRQTEEEERQKQRQDAIKELQKEQTKRSKGKKK